MCNECLKWELITLLRSALYAVISHLRRCAEHAVIILLRHAERVVIASELLLTRNVVLSFYYDVHARRDWGTLITTRAFTSVFRVVNDNLWRALCAVIDVFWCSVFSSFGSKQGDCFVKVFFFLILTTDVNSSSDPNW